jgi:release factor glutamine methyltransferase
LARVAIVGEPFGAVAKASFLTFRERSPVGHGREYGSLLHMGIRFHGVALETAPGRVFMPRPATEALVDAALARIDGRRVKVADVGTGTGAIAIAIAAAASHAEVWATDTNADAVALARANAMRNGVADRVHVLQGTLLEPVPDPVELVVANLPYLPEATRDAPEHAALKSEPLDAVYAPGDGLGPYRSLLDACEVGKLIEGGHVLIQFHRQVRHADCWNLAALRRQLEDGVTA